MIPEEPRYKRIMLLREERSFLLLRCDMSLDLKSQLERDSDIDPIEAWVDVDEADELRAILTEILQTEGFDCQYRPIPDGQMAERLIDKLYTG